MNLRATGEMLVPDTLPRDTDPVEIHIDTMVPGEHVIAFGAVHAKLGHSVAQTGVMRNRSARPRVDSHEREYWPLRSTSAALSARRHAPSYNAQQASCRRDITAKLHCYALAQRLSAWRGSSVPFQSWNSTHHLFGSRATTMTATDTPTPRVCLRGAISPTP